MNRLLVSAAHKSSGKTTLAVGLAAALRAQGLAVQAFKKGPDYIDPMWLALASGRPCFNLDLHLMPGAEIDAAFARRAAGADLALVEGNKGLYDGLERDGSDCNAALAKRLRLPVLLVVDTRGMTRGIAPLLMGYRAFDADVNLAGVVLNQVGGPRHEAKLRAAVEQYTGLPVLGALQRDEALALAERHLGLVPSAEHPDALRHVRRIAEAVSAQVDLAAVRALAQSAQARPRAVPEPAAPAADVPGRKVRIAIARDAAFGFYYPDDLEQLERAGAELLPFDLLRDGRLPACDGLFIGGGFPEMFAPQIEANAAMRGALREAIAGGLPAYAECGGLMVLARSLTWQGRRHAMAGAIPGDVTMHPRPVGRGYVRLAETADCPWPAGGELRGHEFHHSSLHDIDPSLRHAFEVRRGHGIDGRRDGLVVQRLLACYTHQRHVGGNGWPRRFVAYVRSCSAARDAAAPAPPDPAAGANPRAARPAARAAA